MNCSFLPGMHYLGYNFLGQGTKLDKNKKPIKKLDEAAREHNYFYKNHKHKQDISLIKFKNKKQWNDLKS